eukprot:6202245-Pleurochrysis_carterae.AAC.2
MRRQSRAVTSNQGDELSPKKDGQGPRSWAGGFRDRLSPSRLAAATALVLIITSLQIVHFNRSLGEPLK